MRKPKWLRKLKLGNYFRELSIVIIGVAVTLYATGVINSAREKKDLKLQLNTIYTELEDNLARLDKLIEFSSDLDQLKKNLRKKYYTPEEVNADTLKKYNARIGEIHTFIYKHGAYDMLINSGAMKNFKDRKLLLDISECYAMMESTKEGHDAYSDMIQEMFIKLYEHETQYLLHNFHIEAEPLRGILNLYIAATNEKARAQETRKQIEKVLAQKPTK